MADVRKPERTASNGPKPLPGAMFDAKADDDYEAKGAADTLMRAEEIKNNKDLHERAQRHVRKRFHAAARAMTGGKRHGGRFTARAKLAEGAKDGAKY